jgi:FlaA1/EpsC-like NDP-sugar epimerase
LKVGQDVEIAYVGLRPGEKLFEELHAEGETRLPTRHPKIMIADCRSRDPEGVCKAVDRLLAMADGHPAAVLRQLHVTVPEYGAREPTSTREVRVAA